MHPEIADFSSRTMSQDLLRSAFDIEEKRREIVLAYPFSGDALHLIDLSGMMSVCRKTPDNSRINVLSAMVTMGIAVKVAENQEVGIITPYNAQSRLMHSMLRDVLDKELSLKTITCATVHQFQGSEKDVILYDAVDCYRMKYPGILLPIMSSPKSRNFKALTFFLPLETEPDGYGYHRILY